MPAFMEGVGKEVKTNLKNDMKGVKNHTPPVL
jgi:hypothetical protein